MVRSVIPPSLLPRSQMLLVYLRVRSWTGPRSTLRSSERDAESSIGIGSPVEPHGRFTPIIALALLTYRLSSYRISLYKMAIWNRLKYLWPSHRRREEQEMQEELASLTAFASRKELGNLTLAMEDARATWGWTWLDGILADIRYSLRAIGKQPAFVAVAVLSLALAIGANSAIFSFADALLLRPLPVRNPGAVFDVSNNTPDNPFEGMSFPDFRDLREKSRSFSGMIAYRVTARSEERRVGKECRSRWSPY